MKDERGDRPVGPTRRDVLIGAAAVALAASAKPVLGLTKKRLPKPANNITTAAPQRLMAASAALPDGRVLVTGGYDKAWTDGKAVPLQSAMIYDPIAGSWSVAAPMRNPRARHAAVALEDGRIAVLGGIGMHPTAAVEIYDPFRDAWESARPLSSARYDHSATVVGGAIHVIGGNAGLAPGGAESYRPAANPRGPLQ